MVSIHVFYLPHEKEEALRTARELSDWYNYSIHMDLVSPGGMKDEQELRKKLTELRQQYEELDKSECTEENRLIRYDLLKAKYEAMHVLRSEMAILEWALDEPKHWRTSWEMKKW